MQPKGEHTTIYYFGWAMSCKEKHDCLEIVNKNQFALFARFRFIFF